MFKGKDKNYRILGICGSKMPNEDVKSMMDMQKRCRQWLESHDVHHFLRPVQPLT